MTDEELAGRMVQAIAYKNAREYVDWGTKIGRLYTDDGLPIDFGLRELEKKLTMTEDQKLLVIHGACGWLVEHKRNSGATEKSIERQRKLNRDMLRRFLTKGEVGAY
jgi:hypothetical protein